MNDGPQHHVRPHRSLEALFVDLTRAHDALDAVERATPRLSDDQRTRFDDMTRRGNKDAALWRTAHIALRIALERFAGIGIREVAYVIDPGGRPRLAAADGLMPCPHFNLSHTGGYALIAVSHAGPVGIDLEADRAVSISGDRRQRIEAAAVRLSPDQPLPVAPDARFLQAWVRLEAVAKAGGQGIGQILTEAGVVGGSGSARDTQALSTHPVRDLTMQCGCYAAIAGAGCQQLLTIENFPTDAVALSEFLLEAT